MELFNNIEGYQISEAHHILLPEQESLILNAKDLEKLKGLLEKDFKERSVFLIEELWRTNRVEDIYNLVLAKKIAKPDQEFHQYRSFITLMLNVEGVQPPECLTFLNDVLSIHKKVEKGIPLDEYLDEYDNERIGYHSNLILKNATSVSNEMGEAFL